METPLTTSEFDKWVEQSRHDVPFKTPEDRAHHDLVGDKIRQQFLLREEGRVEWESPFGNESSYTYNVFAEKVRSVPHPWPPKSLMAKMNGDSIQEDTNIIKQLLFKLKRDPSLECAACGRWACSLVCSRCNKQRYCSRVCQKEDWKRQHKKACSGRANITEVGDEYQLTQPRLIQSIIADLGLDGPDNTPKDIPVESSKLLSRHKDSPDFDGHFNYRQVMGKLNFLTHSTRGDISYATHMCARFCQEPKQEHGAALKWVGGYLAGTKDKGIIIKPDPSKGLEAHSNADFAGAWDLEPAGEGVDTVRSIHPIVAT